MPLDTSTTYPLTKLRLDGRRWNELRLIQAQISTNPASSGSSYLSMGNTAIMCTVHGPAEGRRGEAGGGAGSAAGAIVEVDVNIAGFAMVDRKRKAGGGDRYVTFHNYLEDLIGVLAVKFAHILTCDTSGNLLSSPPGFALHFNPTSTRICTHTVP